MGRGLGGVGLVGLIEHFINVILNEADLTKTEYEVEGGRQIWNAWTIDSHMFS